MKNERVTVKILGSSIELRIHGWGYTGKGDRLQLLTKKEGRQLVYKLLSASEDLDSSARRAA